MKQDNSVRARNSSLIGGGGGGGASSSPLFLYAKSSSSADLSPAESLLSWTKMVVTVPPAPAAAAAPSVDGDLRFALIRHSLSTQARFFVPFPPNLRGETLQVRLLGQSHLARPETETLLNGAHDTTILKLNWQDQAPISPLISYLDGMYRMYVQGMSFGKLNTLLCFNFFLRIW